MYTICFYIGVGFLVLVGVCPNVGGWSQFVLLFFIYSKRKSKWFPIVVHFYRQKYNGKDRRGRIFS